MRLIFQEQGGGGGVLLLGLCTLEDVVYIAMEDVNRKVSGHLHSYTSDSRAECEGVCIVGKRNRL